MRKRPGWAPLAVTLLLLSCDSDRPPPSILFVLVDTLRPDFLGCYGFDGPVSPALDRIAAESHVFQHAYAQAPWTKPSVASLFCSLYPAGHGVNTEHRDEHGVLTQNSVLPAEAWTLAEALREFGYDTAAFVANPWITAESGYDQGFDHFESMLPDTTDQAKTPAGEVFTHASSWLESRRGRKPVFLYVHLMDVHAPYNAPEEIYQAMVESPGARTPRVLTAQELGRVPGYMREIPWMHMKSVTLLATWFGRYAAGVRTVDDALAAFLEHKRVRDLFQIGWTVVTSDHGEELCEHGGWNHGATLFEELLRVPLIIRPPSGLPAGWEHTDMVRLMDVMPTLLAAVGVPAPEALDGRDLTPLFTGDPLAPIASFAMGTVDRPGAVALNAGRLKLIADMDAQRYVLFDLDRNPGEQMKDATPMTSETAQGLLDEMKRFMAEQTTRTTFTPAANALSPEQKELLRSLGYVN